MDKIQKFNIRLLIFLFILLFTATFIGDRINDHPFPEDVNENASDQIRKVEKTPESEDITTGDTVTSGTISKNDSPEESKDPLENSPTPTQGSLISQLPSHNTSADCWIYYNGHIYDISGYFGSHPGGNALLEKYCGFDATDAFNTKDIGIPHSSAAHAALANFLIE